MSGAGNDEPPPVISPSAELGEAKAEVRRLKKENRRLKKEVERRERLGEFEATFYTADCAGCSGITKTGIDVRKSIYTADGKRIIAVDPARIPLGSSVVVTLENGDSFEAVAGDTGGDIKGARIDVLVETRQEAYKLGRQSASVEIINE